MMSHALTTNEWGNVMDRRNIWYPNESEATQSDVQIYFNQ